MDSNIKKKIRIKLESFNHELLNLSCEQIINKIPVWEDTVKLAWVINTIDFIESEYIDFTFKYSLVNCEMDINREEVVRLPHDLEIFNTKKESQI